VIAAEAWTATPDWRHAVPLRAIDAYRAAPDDAGGWSVEARLAVRDDGEMLRGHFPGLPIYPGVYLVESVVQAVAAAVGASALALRELRSVRFVAALRGGETLALTAGATPLGEGCWRVTAHCRRDTGDLAAEVKADLGPLWPVEARDA